MGTPRTLIIRTAGTNCDRETAHAFSRAGSTVDHVHVERLVLEPERIRECDIFVLPGGFTYGDDLGAGTILSNRLRGALGEGLARHVENGGLVVGICNGFQILVKTGLLPGLDGTGEPGEATLSGNDSNRFEDRWVLLEAATDKSPFVRKGDRILCPVAHAEGKFVTRDEATLERLEAGGQVVFRYLTHEGEPDPGYPENPNGSANSIAGICDPTGRILGMMPHPERHVEPAQHPTWTRSGPAEAADGLRLFENAVSAVRI